MPDAIHGANVAPTTTTMPAVAAPRCSRRDRVDAATCGWEDTPSTELGGPDCGNLHLDVLARQLQIGVVDARIGDEQVELVQPA